MPSPAPVIDEDRRCGGCGYDLRGLAIDGVCPECARPISESRLRRVALKGPELGASPGLYLLALAAGLILAGAGAIVAAPAAHFCLQSSNKPGWCLAGVIAAAGWALGVLAVAALRPTRGSWAGVADDDRLRRTVRFTAVAASFAFIGVFFFARLAATGRDWAWIAAAALAPLALASPPVAAVILSFISEWAMHEGLTRRLRAAAWLLAACPIIAGLGLLIDLARLPAAALLLSINWLLELAWLFSLAFLGLMCLEMIAMLAWARYNAHERAQRDARLALRRKAHDAAVSDRFERAIKASTPESPPAEIPIAFEPAVNSPATEFAPSSPPTPRLPGEGLINPTPGTTPYPLEKQ